MNDRSAADLPRFTDVAAVPDEVIALSAGPANVLQGHWPDRHFAAVGRAELHTYHPKGAAAGRALVLAGGGYLRLMHDREGAEIARWLNALGLAAHVLVHRLPGQPCPPQRPPAGEPGEAGVVPAAVWPFDIALRDGLAALDHLARLPRLPLFHVGLSSGGHLAGVLACQRHALQPAGVLIAYAPLNANHRRYKAPAGKPDYPPPEKQAFYDAWPVGIAAEPHGLPRCPAFLAYALKDAAVPIDHALNFVKAVQQADGEVELHVFAQAPHGFALRELNGTHDQWPALAARWLASRLWPSGHGGWGDSSGITLMSRQFLPGKVIGPDAGT